MSLTVTYQLTPGDDASRRTLNIPRSIDADSGEAVAFFVETYEARRTAGDSHGQALSQAIQATRTEFPKSNPANMDPIDGAVNPARAAAVAASVERVRAYRTSKGLPA